MSDPAIEAAQRALESHTGGVLQMADIAREALKPIRELHKPYSVDEPDGTWSFCNHDHLSWPCETARLIYSTGELES